MVTQTDKEQAPRNIWELINRVISNSIIGAILLMVLYGIYDLEVRRDAKQAEVVDRLITIVEQRDQ